MRLLFLVLGLAGLVTGCYMAVLLLSDRFVNHAIKGGFFDDASSVPAYWLFFLISVLLCVCGLGSVCFGVGL